LFTFVEAALLPGSSSRLITHSAVAIGLH